MRLAAFSIRFVGINEQARARGTFVELVPHSRIVFTFGWEGDDQPVPPGSSTVEVTLTPCTRNGWVRVRSWKLDLAVRTRCADVGKLSGDLAGWVFAVADRTGEGTHVRLVHRGLRSIQARTDHREGWRVYLERLNIRASGGKPGADPHVP